jgi:aryl-alcohol dehydrogenase-like predicted oxidoreductase
MSRTRSYVAKGFSSMKMMATPAMDYINLGSSDLSVSKICLGTMTWGQQNTMAEGIEQLDIAFNEYGINFLDTAEMYPVPTKPETQGETDRVIAKWLKGRDRSKVIIASKVSGASERITWLPGRNGNGARVSKKDIMVSVEESLKRLGTDYIDLVQIHWPDRYVPLFGGAAYDQSLEREFYSFEEQLRAFDDLIKQGKVRHGTRSSYIT